LCKMTGKSHVCRVQSCFVHSTSADSNSVSLQAEHRHSRSSRAQGGMAVRGASAMLRLQSDLRAISTDPPGERVVNDNSLTRIMSCFMCRSTPMRQRAGVGKGSHGYRMTHHTITLTCPLQTVARRRPTSRTCLSGPPASLAHRTRRGCACCSSWPTERQHDTAMHRARFACAVRRSRFWPCDCCWCHMEVCLSCRIAS